MAIALEDFAPGQVFEGAPIEVARDEMIAFAKAYDPQPFHLDESAARDGFVGELIGSGWYTASLGMRLLHRDGFRGHSTMGSPGIETLRWLKPVRGGDRLRARIAVEETRPSDSKADRGYVRFLMTLLDAHDAAVMTQAFSVIVPRRGAPPPTPRALEPEEAPGAHADASTPPAPRPLSMLRDAEVGTVQDLGTHLFAPDAITDFARRYDPQAMHLAAESAARTHFGGLCASGWQTAAVWMARLHATWTRDAALTQARGLRVPELGPSPGFEAMRWLRPVYAGDRLRYTTELIGKRASRSRPGWGIATHRNGARNQRGEAVFAFTGTVFWQWDP